MKLDDLLPVTPQATIQNKAYMFRAPSLADDVWIKAHIGDAEHLKAMVNKLDWTSISKLAYHLIDDNGRKDFKARKAILISEETGDEVERFFTGPEVLLNAISGVENGVQVLGAITRALANSNPMVEDMVKKSLADAKKLNSLIGGTSSTRSPVNTKSPKKNSRR